MGRTTENMQNMLPIFAIQPVWGLCCYPPLVGPYAERRQRGRGGASSSSQPPPTQDEPPPSQGLPLPTQDERPPRLPPDLKKELGDDRFNFRTRHGRAHVCDACNVLYTFYSQAYNFDGQWYDPPPAGWRQPQMESMWEQGLHDFRWFCTTCRFAESNYTNLKQFRIDLGIDHVEERQHRTQGGWVQPRRRQRRG